MQNPETIETIAVIQNRPDLLAIVGECKNSAQIYARVGPLLVGIATRYVNWNHVQDWAVNNVDWEDQ